MCAVVSSLPLSPSHSTQIHKHVILKNVDFWNKEDVTLVFSPRNLSSGFHTKAKVLSVLNRPEAEEPTLFKVDLSPKTSAQHRGAPYGVFAREALGLIVVIPWWSPGADRAHPKVYSPLGLGWSSRTLPGIQGYPCPSKTQG